MKRAYIAPLTELVVMGETCKGNIGDFSGKEDVGGHSENNPGDPDPGGTVVEEAKPFSIWTQWDDE